MRVRHASPVMVQTPSSPSTLIGDDIPVDTHSELKVPLPSKQHYNSQTSATASSQVPARVTDKAPFPLADALILAFEQQQRAGTRKRIRKFPDDQWRRELQVLMIKIAVLCDLMDPERRLSCGSRGVLRLERSMVHSQDTHDLNTRPGGGKMNQLTNSHSLEKNEAVVAVQEKSGSGGIKASLNPKGHRPKKLIVKFPFEYPLSDKRPLPKDQAENSADVKPSLNPKGHRPKKLIVKLPLKAPLAPLGGKRPLPENKVEEGDKDMAGATRAINPQKKRRLAAPPAQKKVLRLRLGGRTSRA